MKLALILSVALLQSAQASLNERSTKHIARQSAQRYRLTEDLSGEKFLDAFAFEAGRDPNGGASVYTTEAQARSGGLVRTTTNSLTLSVDTTKKVSVRKSVKIVSKRAYNSGLFIVDVQHLPTGPGVWPAHWAVSKDGNWPNSGGIDIIEYVHDFTHNSHSIHTGKGCSMSRKGFTSAFMLKQPDANNCAVHETDNQGCGLRDVNAGTAGAPFNKAGGGVYATQWTSSAISMWFFPRNKIPKDIKAKNPNPAGWGTPRARFAGFNVGKCVKDQSLVFNTLLCGTWADGVWNSVNTAAGQKNSAAAQTGYKKCSDYVLNNGQNFKEAYWTINSLQIYQ